MLIYCSLIYVEIINSETCTGQESARVDDDSIAIGKKFQSVPFELPLALSPTFSKLFKVIYNDNQERIILEVLHCWLCLPP